MTHTFGARHKHKVNQAWLEAEAAVFVSALGSTQGTVFNAAAAPDDMGADVIALAATRQVFEYAFENLRPV